MGLWTKTISLIYLINMFNINIFIFKPITKYINTSFLQFWSFAGHSSSRWWPAVAVSTDRARTCPRVRGAWLAWPKGGLAKGIGERPEVDTLKNRPNGGFHKWGTSNFVWLVKLVKLILTILKNDGVRQWEGWHPIYEMENTKFRFETTNQLLFISWKILFKWMMTGGTPISGKLQIKSPRLSYTTLHNHWHFLSLISPPI